MATKDVTSSTSGGMLLDTADRRPRMEQEEEFLLFRMKGVQQSEYLLELAVVVCEFRLNQLKPNWEWL